MLTTHHGPHPSESQSATAVSSMDTNSSDHTMNMGSTDTTTAPMHMAGPDLFPVPVTIAWTAGLIYVLIHHLTHVTHHRDHRRWFHIAHIVMALSMIDMYVGMEWNLSRIPSAFWMWLYVAITVATAAFIVFRLSQRRSLSRAWLFLLLSNAAMIYMWMPMSAWQPWFTYLLVTWFTVEAVLWLIGRIDNTTSGRSTTFGPGDPALAEIGHGNDWAGRICMAIMAASMAYMFLGMQVM